MDLSIPVTHTKIQCKFRSYKTKVYLTYRPIKVRIEVGALETASNSASMLHAIFLTINSVFLIFHIVFCTHKIGKRAKEFPR